MRSVGLIEVSVRAGDGIEQALSVAAAKGGELGCWIVVEHGAFVVLQARRASDLDGRALLAHGSPSHVPHIDVPAPKLVTFDCVVRPSAAPSR